MVSQEYLESFLTEDYRKRIGERLKYARKRFNQNSFNSFKLTQKKMAELLHIERQRIINIVNGKAAINFMELVFYSKLCGFHINEFLFDEADTWEESFFPEDLNGNVNEYEVKEVVYDDDEYVDFQE